MALLCLSLTHTYHSFFLSFNVSMVTLVLYDVSIVANNKWSNTYVSICALCVGVYFLCAVVIFFSWFCFFLSGKKNLFAWCLFFCFVWFHLAEWLNSWIVVDGWMYYSHRIFFSIVLYQFVCQHQFTKIKTR